MTRKVATLAVALYGLLAIAAPARAQGPAPVPAGTWQIDVAPFVWLPSVAGNITVRGHTIEDDMSIGDILSKSKFPIALMAHAEARNGDFGLFIEPMYMELRFTPSRRNLSADITTQMFFLEFGGFWRALQGEVGQSGSGQYWAFDLLAGGRYSDLGNSTTLNFHGPVAGISRSSSQSLVWVDPLLGARLTLDLSPSWTTMLRADIGGFNGGSDMSWQAYGLVGYKFEMWGKPTVAFAGFRALSQDYKSSGSAGFRWNNTLYGPILGLNMTF